MPIFSKPEKNPLLHHYTSSKHSQYTEESENQNRFLRNENDEFVYAKKIITPSSPFGLGPNAITTLSMTVDFYIRLSPDLKSVFDPRIKYCLPERGPDFITKTCKNPGKYVKTTQIVFEKYLNFLETESESQYKELNKLVFGL